MNDQDKKTDKERFFAIRKLIKQAVQKSIRKLEKQQYEFDESNKSLWYQQIGDSLLACSLPVSRGTSKITLTNVHTQIEESVSINPKMNLKENAQLFFKKAKKGKRGEQISGRKVESTLEELTKFQALETEIDTLSNEHQPIEISIIENFEQRLLQITVPHSAESNNANLHEKAKTPYRHFSADGWDIYVGKSDTQNDELTTRFASPGDIWFHVAAHAGSHVVIKRPKGSQFPPPAVLEIAASLSVWFSKVKHTSFAEVNYTEARFVRKRRHSPAGEVIAERCKSIRVSPRSPQEIFPSGMYQDEN